MSLGSGASAWGVPAALLGGAACVSCALAITTTLAAAVGAGAALPLGLPGWAVAGAAAVLVGAAALAARRLRRAEAACVVPPARSPYLRFHAGSALLAVGLAVVAVVGTALAAKAVVEGAGLAAYTIHWTTTVPALVAAFAWMLNGQLNARRAA